MTGRLSLSAVIPTYGREVVLLDNIASLLALADPPDEIVVVDQTPCHEDATDRRLREWSEKGAIRWLRRGEPSIPAAMNHGLVEAKGPIVLFLDDDIVPGAALVSAHRRVHEDPRVVAATGQVLQPGQTAEPRDEARLWGRGLRRDLQFPFNSTTPCTVGSAMAGNLSVKRSAALQAGGFDENFRGAAYRFETEFARRMERTGGIVVFEPAAVIHHLRAPSGGTRTHGRHETSTSPAHSIGDYYFALREGSRAEAAAYIARRVVRELRTRFHLRHPWWIPFKLVGEARGLAGALRLARRGPRYAGEERGSR